MLGCTFRLSILYTGNNFSNINFHLTKFKHYVFTDHTQAANVNTITALTHTVDINKLHHQTPSLCKDTPWTLQTIQCSTVTLTVQNKATQAAAPCGLISDSIQMKQIGSWYEYRCV